MQKRLFFLIFSAFFSIIPFFAIASTECSQLGSTTSIPNGFGASYNLFSPGRELLIRVTCEASGEIVHLGTSDPSNYIYKNGYEWRGSWQPMSYTSSQVADANWFMGNAVASLPPLTTGASLQPQQGYILGYVCQNIGGSWKCGCRDTVCSGHYWQLQTFPKSTAYSATQTQVENDLLSYDGLLLAYSSPYTGPVGTTIAITGAGFTPNNNTVYFGKTQKVSGISAVNPSRLMVQIPNSLDPGVYPIAVENSRGKSDYNSFIAVTRPGAVPPRITSVTPKDVSWGGTLTIRGVNFAPTGNVVMTSYHGYVDVPSSKGGTEIQIPITGWKNFTPTPPEYPKQKRGSAVYIANENGLTSDENSGGFNVEL